MANVLITYGVPAEGFASLAQHTLFIPPALTAYPREKILQLMPQMDAVLACTALDAELISLGTNLKVIICYGAGYDNIDMHAATVRGIPVVNMPDTVTAPTAELAIALMMGLARKITELDEHTHSPQASDGFRIGYRMGISMQGSTLGLIGMGRIAKHVARVARSLNMHVCYTATTQKPLHETEGAPFLPLADLLSQSDFVSIHCPLTEQTEGMLGTPQFARMKPTAFLINTARGKIVQENALIKALADGKIAGAGLDVFPDEPQVNPKLSACSNVLLTPHVGSNTIQARLHMANDASRRLLDIFSGKYPENLLNPQVWKT